MAARYTAGTPVSCYTDEPFTNLTGQPVDPAQVIFRWAVVDFSGRPTGASGSATYAGATTPAVGVIARTGVGAYEGWIDTTELAGRVTWQIEGIGVAIGKGSFWVDPPPIPL